MNAAPVTILIIDDEAALRHSFSDYLEDLDYRTLTAENGRNGIRVRITVVVPTACLV